MTKTVILMPGQWKIINGVKVENVLSKILKIVLTIIEE